MSAPVAAPPVPLTVLVGFLGAGKTTLLRALLPLLRARGIVPRVIINDYRNALIDARTLSGLADSILPISGTCICCDSREELMTALATMPMGERDLVLLEANGTVDAPELVEALTADRRARRFSLPILVGVADAKRWQKRYWHNRLESDQLRAATSIWITRREEVTEERWETVVSGIRRVAPRADVCAPVMLADRLADIVEHADRLPRRRFAPPVLGSPSAHAHRHDAQAHHFASMEIPLRTRITRAALTDFLAALPPEVIRAKGVAFLADNPMEAVLFQKVEGRDAPALMTLSHPERLDPVAVLIGAQCPRADIMALAARYLGLEWRCDDERKPHDNS
jgi:G3E family GTPase